MGCSRGSKMVSSTKLLQEGICDSVEILAQAQG